MKYLSVVCVILFNNNLPTFQVHMMTELLEKFVLVGESAGSNAAVKQVKVVTSAPPPTPAGTLTVTLHVMHDTSAALACEHPLASSEISPLVCL